MYCGHARLCVFLCVCLSVCLSAAACLHYCTDPDVTRWSGMECPLVVHYCADLQSVHRLRCYGNITRTQNVSEYMLCTRSMPSLFGISNSTDYGETFRCMHVVNACIYRVAQNYTINFVVLNIHNTQKTKNCVNCSNQNNVQRDLMSLLSRYSSDIHQSILILA